MTDLYYDNKHVASMQPKKGQHIFMYVIATKQLTMIVKAVTINANKGELFVIALNEQNAVRKFLKLLKACK